MEVFQNTLFWIPNKPNIEDFDPLRERQCSAETLELVRRLHPQAREVAQVVGGNAVCRVVAAVVVAAAAAVVVIVVVVLVLLALVPFLVLFLVVVLALVLVLLVLTIVLRSLGPPGPLGPSVLGLSWSNRGVITNSWAP